MMQLIATDRRFQTTPSTHIPKCRNCANLVTRSEEQVWCTPERHGIMKAQIDWIPLNAEAVRPTQGKTHCQLFAGSWDLLRTAGANCLRHTP